MSDRSTLGVYFADERAVAIQQIAVEANPQGAGTATTATLPASVRALAIYPDPSTGTAAVTLTAIRPDGTRDRLIAFRPQAGWARRYWFREPLVLPRGTRLELQARTEEALLPPGALPPRDVPGTAVVRVVVNVVPES